jgi:serine phosphatase RsbU (regulator of sigma subunit)
MLSFDCLTLKKSTKIWIAVFAVSLVATAIAHSVKADSGCFGVVTAVAAFVSGIVLLAMGVAAAFRATVRRLTLRLAFSYFLIGIVPIPLLAMLLFCAAYIVAHQVVATRVRREVNAVTRDLAGRGGLPIVRISDDTVASSDAAWLKPGEKVPWAKTLEEPRPVLEDHQWIWMADRRSPEDPATLVLVPVSGDPDFLQRLADRTHYSVRIEEGRARRNRSGWQVDSEPATVRREEKSGGELVRPRGSSPPGGSFLDKEWVGAVYVDSVAFPPSSSEKDTEVVVWLAKTSPRMLASQLFAQGVPKLSRIFRAVLLGLSLVLLIVYLVALAIAFVLVGTITRNVNRLTRASRAIARGDFSIRAHSRSRDQIGDLARSFDGMATSIQKLLAETAEKKKLEGEIEIARTIQQKLLPEAEASLPGLSVSACFQPLAAIGGDYYDYFRMPDGRSAIAVGDVSGHGLPTGLLVAMAKAGLSTLIESGLSGPALFARINALIHHSTDSRNYMTLALFAYDPSRRVGELTNAGQLAPYHFSGRSVEAVSLPSFPLGLSERDGFPRLELSVSPGDRLLFVTDGFVEAADEAGEPFGFEKLEALLRAEASSDAGRLKATILGSVAAHIGAAPPADDRTLVILTFQ